MNEALNRINDLSDRLTDARGANATLYLIAQAIAHGEGTATDYSSALVLLYNEIAAQLDDVQLLVGEIRDIINKKGE